MATLRDIKKRISAVGSIKKVTGALKMVSASKLRRSQEKLMGSRSYANDIKNIALEMSMKDGIVENPVFIPRRKLKKAVLIVIATDKGLCGPLNARMAKEMRPFLDLMAERDTDVEVHIMGRRGVKYFTRQGVDFSVMPFSVDIDPPEQDLEKFCRLLLKRFLSEEIDQVMIAFNRFVSTISQQVSLDIFLPIWVKEPKKVDDHVDFIYEPSKLEVMDAVVLESLKATFNESLFEARASELAARVFSMNQAFGNASDLEVSLTGVYNRARQSAITTELLDIIGGAEAIQKG